MGISQTTLPAADKLKREMTETLDAALPKARFHYKAGYFSELYSALVNANTQRDNSQSDGTLSKMLWMLMQ